MSARLRMSRALVTGLVLLSGLGCQPTPATAPAPTAADGQAAPPPAAVAEVPIGDVLPLTGSFSGLGQQYLWSAQTVEDIVNTGYSDLQLPLGKQAGLPGLGGAKVKFVVRDDQSKGELARTIAEQLITVDKVAFLNGDGTSGNTSIIQPIAETHGIPFACHACASPSLTDKPLKWFWRTGPNDRSMLGSVFTFLKEWPNNGGPADLKTLAVFSCDNLFCQDGRKVALDLAREGGFKLVEDLTIKVGTATVAPEVQRLQAANPDVLLLIQYAPEATVFQADAKRAGWNPRTTLTNNGAYSDETWLQAQKKTNGGAGWFGRDPSAIDLASKKPSWQQVDEIYKKYSNGQNMGEVSMRELTGLMWMLDTINRARSLDPAAIATAADQTNTPADQLIIDYKGIKFDENHQNTLATGVVTQVGWDGEKHTVWPWDLGKQAGYQVITPNPGWDERDSRPRP